MNEGEDAADIASTLANRVVPKTTDYRSFDSTMKSAVTNLLWASAVPWFKSCLKKYSEDEFHARMAAGFDFVIDWKTNHAMRYRAFIFGLRAIRDRLYYDSYSIVEGVVEGLEKEGGWTITQQEKARLWTAIEQVRLEVYGGS